RLASNERFTIVPRGGGSGLCGGATADGSVVLNMTRMDKVLEIGRRFVVVQSGIILDTLNGRLRKKFMPVQPASHSMATIGGMISTNAGGEAVLRFGKMSQSIISMEVVSGDGRLLKIGRNIGDFCGTEGITGVVVEAKLKIVPRLPERSVTVRELSNIRELVEFVRPLVKDKRVVACEFLNPKMHRMSRGKGSYFLLVEFIGGAGEIKDKKASARQWRIRERCYHDLWQGGWRMISDPEIPLRNTERFLRWCEEQAVPAFGHIGHGIIHVHFRNQRKMDGMYRLVRTLGGKISGEHGIGITKKKYLPPSMKMRLRSLKKKYDPGNILNPGKVV
ncbi:MAG: FAD-binding oxidoreductase, partial [candidate division Zixibacteria bacterium]|nr:FAD-binding oxidoreductase [candidate division Zixibacteria bacterium]